MGSLDIRAVDMGSFDQVMRYRHVRSEGVSLELTPEPLLSALHLWQQRFDRRGSLPTRRDIPVTDLPAKVIGTTNLVDVEYGPDGDLNFRMRLYGTANIVHSTFRPEGRLMQDLELDPFYVEDVLIQYKQAVSRSLPMLHQYFGMLEDRGIERDYQYDRLLLPLGDDTGKVVVLMVMTKRQGP